MRQDQHHSASSVASTATSSAHSDHSWNTAPSSTSPASKPSLRRGETAGPVLQQQQQQQQQQRNIARNCSFDPRASIESYASTVPSDDDDDQVDYDDAGYSDDDDSAYVDNGVLAATPVEFAELFPSNRRLVISHDDTVDGNLNLRVDTLVKMPKGGLRPFTLFHLRMRDLKTRDFSLRRYCRDSGREVCSSIRKYHKPAESRPALQRSVSTLANIFTRSEPKDSSLKCADSGYESIMDEFEKPAAKPTKSMTLEFSNYAHVDITRRSSNGTKSYPFSYWGTSYRWQKHIKKTGSLSETSYRLFKNGSKTPLASIIPDILTVEETAEEDAKHGWVPPCSMRILDNSIISGNPDAADVIIATGLLALVDDNIKRLNEKTTGLNIVVPVPMKGPLKMNVEYITPRKLLGEVFGRRASTFSGRDRPATPVSVR